MNVLVELDLRFCAAFLSVTNADFEIGQLIDESFYCFDSFNLSLSQSVLYCDSVYPCHVLEYFTLYLVI